MGRKPEESERDVICEVCGEIFKATRSSKKTCSDTCRKRKERKVTLEDIVTRDSDLVSRMLSIGNNEKQTDNEDLQEVREA